MRVYLILMFVVAAGCASRPPEPTLPASIPEAPTPREEENIDLLGLQKSLRMERPMEQLGYAEKAFNTCQAGYGYSSSHNCRQRHLVVIHFRLQCRDSEGTVSEMVTLEELQPVLADRMRWHLGSVPGTTSTDGEGYGQIRAVMSQSAKTQRLRLTVKNDFLLLTANQVKRIIVPKSWCRL